RPALHFVSLGSPRNHAGAVLERARRPVPSDGREAHDGIGALLDRLRASVRRGGGANQGRAEADQATQVDATTEVTRPRPQAGPRPPQVRDDRGLHPPGRRGPRRLRRGPPSPAELEPFFTNDAPVETVVAGVDGWLSCPGCARRFSPRDAQAWT